MDKIAPDEAGERLREKLAGATAAAADAYRQTSRLIRVLTVLGQPSSPTELVERTLAVLSQVYAADVTVSARVVAGRLQLTGTCGIPEGDAAYTDGWPLAGAAAEAIAAGTAIARTGAALDPDTDFPPSLAGLAPASAVWVPAGEDGTADELLIMFRSRPDGFPSADLPVLRSVASRLRLAVQARRRSATVENLARLGHRLTSCLDLPTLYDEAARLFPILVGGAEGGVVTIEDGVAALSAATRTDVLPDGYSPQVAKLWGWEALSAGETYCGVHDGFPMGGSVLAVPVMRDDAPAAVLYAFRYDGVPFRSEAAEAGTLFGTYVGVAMNNAELYLALQASENSLRLITESISDLIAVVDDAGRFVYASPSYERELALPPGRLLGTPVAALAHPGDRAAVAAALTGPAHTPTIEYRLLTGEDRWVWVESALRPMAADNTVVLSSRVIDRRRRLEDELRRRATHDPLTGLANRALTADRLNAALARVDAPDHVGLLFCDLDKFKDVNDRLGHDAGDQLLVQAADRLRGCMRQGDLLARFGGDEFVVLLDGVTDLDDVRAAGDRVVEAMEVPFPLLDERVEISASVGGVLGVRGHADPATMLRDADAAMYAAKHAGRGRAEVFDDAASRRSLDRLQLRSDLAFASARGELAVHYQPIVELSSSRIIGFEALCRWHHPVRGLVPPDEFIPLAEETGAITAIGEWVLGQACRQLAGWRRLLSGERLGISVNLSPVQLHQADAAARTLKVIEESGADPADVWLETTEHSAIRIDVNEFATTLRAAGVHFALDDFGISYSSLSHLKRLPVESVKIDRSFVAGLPDTATDRGIVRAVLAIAESLSLTVVAEGIETPEQHADLVALGCQLGQGYLFSRPVPPDEATALLLAGVPQPSAA
ncbi:putative bifunctional diguanylate cyclase/phosphodiesterase [Pseudosporangium ferrugineum]|uniref:PAS domain S-box-containing protein/diguanylate cyclase (GGDEF)-like protein n=1 Tax=Pseudosporangium ferrugineum TaxID=439699 RepID=A0A2T0SET6_9ACTN|nr:bifunctional diguanylate cyclase/phosphodiesterase [Pseudosporangium ferrugineum]PRY31924.1 PAS domain S-box-containing protein/diguanylate cyclase (GGDEF)-like protein [Pseudosporangium ferrugineum]